MNDKKENTPKPKLNLLTEEIEKPEDEIWWHKYTPAELYRRLVKYIKKEYDGIKEILLKYSIRFFKVIFVLSILFLGSYGGLSLLGKAGGDVSIKDIFANRGKVQGVEKTDITDGEEKSKGGFLENFFRLVGNKKEKKPFDEYEEE